MGKPIRGAGGRFAGSIGEGKTKVPTAARPIQVPLFRAPGEGIPALPVALPEEPVGASADTPNEPPAETSVVAAPVAPLAVGGSGQPQTEQAKSQDSPRVPPPVPGEAPWGDPGKKMVSRPAWMADAATFQYLDRSGAWVSTRLPTTFTRDGLEETSEEVEWYDRIVVDTQVRHQGAHAEEVTAAYRLNPVASRDGVTLYTPFGLALARKTPNRFVVRQYVDPATGARRTDVGYIHHKTREFIKDPDGDKFARKVTHGTEIWYSLSGDDIPVDHHSPLIVGFSESGTPLLVAVHAWTDDPQAPDEALDDALWAYGWT